MIPDEYWQLGRRWWRLILAFVVLGAIVSPFVMPTLIGSKSSASYNSTAALQVSHYATSGGIITPGLRTDADDIVAGYAESLQIYAETPQFYADVQEHLVTAGVTIHRQEAEASLHIQANPTLFRINILARHESLEVAEALVQAAADTLIARGAADEAATTVLLAADLEEEQIALLERLAALDAPEAGGPLVDVERSVINEQLRALTLEKEQLLSNRKDAITIINGPDSVQSEASIVPVRDLILLGIALGLILGWLAANVAERLRPRDTTIEGVRARQVALAGATVAGTRMRWADPRLTEEPRRSRMLIDTSEPRDESEERG